jgi:hypothetical protein
MKPLIGHDAKVFQTNIFDIGRDSGGAQHHVAEDGFCFAILAVFHVHFDFCAARIHRFYSPIAVTLSCLFW